MRAFSFTLRTLLAAAVAATLLLSSCVTAPPAAATAPPPPSVRVDVLGVPRINNSGVLTTRNTIYQR